VYYEYDGLGQRRNEHTRIFYANGVQVVAPSSRACVWGQTTIALSEPELQLTTAGLRLTLSDYLGSPRVVIDATGLVQERNSYYPSGLQIDALSSTAAGTSDYTAGWANGQRIPAFAAYPGQLNGRRYLDPAISSWYAVEPLATQYANLSPYSYAGGDPINFADRTGLFIETGFREDGTWGETRGASSWLPGSFYNYGTGSYGDNTSPYGYIAPELSWEQIKSDFEFESTWGVSATASNRRAVQRGYASGQISTYSGFSAQNLHGYLVGAESLGMLGSDANSLVNNDGWRNYVADGMYQNDMIGLAMRNALAGGAGGTGGYDSEYNRGFRTTSLIGIGLAGAQMISALGLLETPAAAIAGPIAIDAFFRFTLNIVKFAAASMPSAGVDPGNIPTNIAGLLITAGELASNSKMDPVLKGTLSVAYDIGFFLVSNGLISNSLGSAASTMEFNSRLFNLTAASDIMTNLYDNFINLRGK
jgi:RHS repeat-associated protein